MGSKQPPMHMDTMVEQAPLVIPSAQSSPNSPEAKSDHQDGGVSLGTGRRRRHCSDSGLPLPPLPQPFTQAQLETWLDFFRQQRIYEWKIFQHLQGGQLLSGEEVANYPGISASAEDTGATALHVAAAWGHTELTRALLKVGADPGARHLNGSSPIHLAISQGRLEVVAILVGHTPSLVDSYNNKNGFYPLHTASLHKAKEIAKVLVYAGAKVEQNTEVTKISPAPLTVFHLAVAEFAKIKTKRIKDRAEVERRMTNVMEARVSLRLKTLSRASTTDCKKCGGEEERKEDCDQLKERTLEMLEFLMSRMPESSVTFCDYSKGSLLHCFCSVDWSPGVATLLSPTFQHPPDPRDRQGVTPLLLALSLGHLASARELLAHPINASLVHPIQRLAPLQMLIKHALTITTLHLEVVQLLLDQSADPTVAMESDSPVCMATNDTLDVKLLDKFLDYLDSSNINTVDRTTGDTLLHFAVASKDRNDIIKLLEKGADIMIDNRSEERKAKNSVLPMEVAVKQGQGAEYFAALMTYGFNRLVEAMRGDMAKTERFLQTHLVGGSKEKEREFVQEVLLVLQAPRVLQLTLTREQLQAIIHYTRGTSSTVFSKTALSWANENNDRATCMELLRLERQVHGGEDQGLVDGLRCLKNHLTSDSLLPWIIDTYNDFYSPGSARWIMAIMSVLCELVVVSYIPYIYDFYSDIDLAVQYRRIGQENSSFYDSELWYCRDERISGEVGETDHYREHFLKAYWITSVTIAISAAIYIVTVLLHSNPRFIMKWEGRFRRHLEASVPPRVLEFTWRVVEAVLVVGCKLAWPVVHMVRRVRYRASTRRSGERCLVLESDVSWGVVKTVEHGLEASSQLFLQLWLLVLYLPVISMWDSSQTLIRSVTGAANFLTFDLYPACFLEKSLGKVALNLVSLSLGAAFTKVTKHGVVACDRPLRVVPIFTSYVLQILARLYAFRLLLLIDSPLGQYKLLIFFLVHFLLVFVFRVAFEDINLRNSPLRLANLRHSLISIARMLLGVLSSSIIMVHLHTPDIPKRVFLSHAAFFLLVLVEHLVILLLSLPPLSSAVWVLVLWLASAMLHLLHYTWSHPWAALNGPSLPWRRDQRGETQYWGRGEEPQGNGVQLK